MQNNDTRLVKAAKRTIRAEITLVITIIIITSWSIYALYLLSTGNADSILGVSLSKRLFGIEKQSPSKSASNTTASSSNRLLKNKTGQSHEATNQLPIYMSPEEIHKRTTILRDLISAKQHQLYHQQLAQLALQAPSAMMALQRLRLAQDPSMVRKTSATSPETQHSSESSTNDESGPENEPDDQAEAGLSAGQDKDGYQNDDDADSEPPQSEQRVNEEESTPTDNADDEPSNDQEKPEEPVEDDSATPDELVGGGDKSRDLEETTEVPAAKTSHQIDEDVDRMTQPSSGVASRQDQPFDYRGVVKFDDAPTKVRPKSAPKISIGIQPRFVDPNSSPISEVKHSTKNKTPERADNMRRSAVVMRIDDGGGKKTHNQRRYRSQPQHYPVPETNRTSRGKRSPVGSVETLPSDNRLSLTNLGLPGVSISNMSMKNHVAAQHKPKKLRKLRKLPYRMAPGNNSSIRRSEDDYEYETDDDGSNVSVEDETQSKALAPSRYQYLTTNDANLQELLAQQKLLDALSLGQLPAPTLSSVTTDNSTNDKSTSGTNNKESSQDLYTIDPALLLTPAGDEEHHHKSMHKKMMKKSKSKKKMTIAMKKGAHKKKRHKKEEKKYLKEKKFKGAKKGKKSSKGKGGQGGKKGKKFYKDKGFKKKGFKNVYHKEEFGQKKSYFDEFRDKDFKKKWKKFDDKYNYAKMKKWQAKDVKGAKKMKEQGQKHKKYEKGKWKKKYAKEHHEAKKKMSDEFD